MVICSIAVVVTFVFRRPSSTSRGLARAWARLLVRASGVSVRVESRTHLDPARPYLFAANHQSQFDIFALQGYLGLDFHWLAKKELFRVPFLGQAMRAADSIPVDRMRGRAAMKSLEEAAARISSGNSVIIFPEGTRSWDGNLQPFKSGAMVLAIKARVPVVPVAIIGTHRILPRGRLIAVPGRVTIRIGDPIETEGYRLRQKHELSERVHAALSKMLAQEH
jgi:1-acyl-sn-glycerol-3-phosphate acyltransferase